MVVFVYLRLAWVNIDPIARTHVTAEGYEQLVQESCGDLGGTGPGWLAVENREDDMIIRYEDNNAYTNSHRSGYDNCSPPDETIDMSDSILCPPDQGVESIPGRKRCTIEPRPRPPQAPAPAPAPAPSPPPTGKQRTQGAPSVRWSIEKIGPFTTTGDADGKIIPGARAIYVVGSVLRAVGESGEVLAFPPLHIHHLHVNNGPQDNYFDHFPFVEMHGDSACHTDQGGMNCSVRMLPPDTAFRIDTRMTADFDINDVRPKGSPALTWYLEVAVGWLPDKQ
eukprot:gene21306-33568_t